MTPYTHWCENLENVQITLAVKGLNFTDHCGALSVKVLCIFTTYINNINKGLVSEYVTQMIKYIKANFTRIHCN